MLRKLIYFFVLCRLHGSVEGLELIRRETGIRISDCNALSSYGSSLLPLWLHADVHLKQLDSSISKLETSNCKDTEPRCSKTEVTEHKGPNDVDITAASNGDDLKYEASAGVTIGENVKIEEVIPTSSAQSSHDKDAEAVASKVETDSDEIMDVEMEVDEDDIEEQVNSNSVIKECPISEQVSSPSLQSSRGPVPPVDNDAPPPPPEEEWIPPPPPDSEPASLPLPPDSEPAPPPPPEEPVASYVHPGAIPQPYIGQANVGYTIAGMEYYAAVGTEGTNATYYVQASEPHILQSQQHSYYAPLSASGISFPVDGTSYAPESYYTYASVPMAAGAIAAEHSGYYTSSISAISSSAVDTKSSTSLVSANSNLDPISVSDKVISKDAGVPSLSQAVVETSAAGVAPMLGSSSQASTSTTNQAKGNFVSISSCWYFILIYWLLLLQGKQYNKQQQQSSFLVPSKLG
jgi:formin-binding protein 4